MSTHPASGPTAPHALSGSVDLFVPEDLFDLLAPDDRDEALEEFCGLFSRMFPRAGEEDVANLAGGILRWRDRLLAAGTLLHGLVAVPPEDGEPPAHWHVFAGVVDVPRTGELDTGSLLSRLVGRRVGEESGYTESYPTRMGWGAGLITQVAPQPDPEVMGRAAPDTGMDADRAGGGLPPVLGLAAGLAGPHGGDHGLLVVGLCLDVERLLDMAAIVAVIAGESMIHTGDGRAVEEPSVPPPPPPPGVV